MLIKTHWKKEDKTEFDNYLVSLKNAEKIEWTTKIINTKKKVLAIKTDKWYALCSGFVCVLRSVCCETLVKHIKNGCKTA